jgi:SecD/SecF fusion protein
MTPIQFSLYVLLPTLVVYAGLLWFFSRRLRAFAGRLFVCLTPLVIAGLIAGWAVNKYVETGGGFKLGVDLVGGTILVYEIDQNKLSEQARSNLTDLGTKLADRLKKRIDPNDLKNVTIRPVSGGTRVEIILPTGGKRRAEIAARDWQNLLDAVRNHWQDMPSDAKTRGEWEKLKDETFSSVGRGEEQALVAAIASKAKIPPDEIEKVVKAHYKAGEGRDFTAEEIQRVKQQITEVGSLEFLILANQRDDKAAIDVAREFINSGKHKEELDARAKQGLPPPPPIPPAADAVTLPDGRTKGFRTAKGDFTYSWVEIGKEERTQDGLNNAAENADSKGHRSWALAEEARKNGAPAISWNGETLLYSRKSENLNLPDAVRDEKKYEYFFLVRDPAEDPQPPHEPLSVTGDQLSSVRGDQPDPVKGPAVSFSFRPLGAARFGDLTSANVPTGSEENRFERRLAIVMDGYIVSAPALHEAIRDNGQISGNFTQDKVNQMVTLLTSGALPASLKPQPVSESTMDSTLGADTIRDGTISVGIAFAAILIFMLIYYRFAGLVACVALLANLLLTIAFMVLVNASFTLPGLAGLVLMLGMAVDANVLIYERLREERDRGCSLALAIRNGYDRAFPVILDTHLSSIFTAIVLYAVGNDQLKGFGVSLTVGLVISLFTSLYMTRLLFDIWLNRGWLRKLSMFRLLSRPNIDFMRIRYYWFTATILLTVIGITVFILRLPQDLNIDFRGGTAYGGKLAQKSDIEELRRLLDTQRQTDRLHVAGVQELPSTRGYVYRITWEASDGKRDTRTIEFPQQPTGATPEERQADVAKRASELPDMSLVMTYPSSETEEGTGSRHFEVRTVEKAPELVQAEIDRLLVDPKSDQRLLATVAVEQPKGGWSKAITKDGKQVDLKFAGYASPSQLRTLLDREFKQRDIGTSFDVKGLGEANPDGAYQTLQVNLAEPVKPEAKLTGALQATAKAFSESPQPERLETFDAVLAKETQGRAAIAILASWGAILLYLWFRFGNWTFGLAAVLCLIHDLFFTMGIIAFSYYMQPWAAALTRLMPPFQWLWAVCLPLLALYIFSLVAFHRTLQHSWAGLVYVCGAPLLIAWLAILVFIEDFKIDLTAVAALLTLIGYSVNDTIVVFDRIREVRGKNPDLTPQMINDSVNQTLSRTLLTSFATWLVVIVLYLFGGQGVHLFAFVMVIGVIVGTYSSIYIASPLLLIFGEGAKKRVPGGQRQVQPAGARG